ncbi:MFS transporter [Streptomyces sp. NPDC058471]|uniref:MFS transporter n=1 Tax=Streptomyces sp. NPDC058471 TaxID=3346516 RepID=UPI003660970D
MTTARTSATFNTPSVPALDESASSVQKDLRLYHVTQVVQTIGGSVSGVALPMVALIYLTPSIMEMSVLIAARTAPLTVTTLISGALVDRCRRRPLLLWSKASGAILLASIPLAAITGGLSMPLLIVVTLLLAAVNDVSSTAFVSYLPSLAGNGKRFASANTHVWALWSCAQALGRNLAGVLISLLGAGLALLSEVVTCLIGATCLARMRTPEESPQPRGATMWSEVRSGLTYTRRDPVVWALLRCSTARNMALAAWDALLLIFLVQHLSWSPLTVGMVLGCTGGGAIGALLAPRCRNRWGAGPLMLGALGAMPVAMAPVLLVGQAGPWPFVTGAAVAVWSACSAAVGSTEREVRQTHCSPEYRGRQQAVGTWISVAPCALSALAAGQVAELIGLRPAMLLVAIASLAGFTVLARSPARHLRHLPPSGSPGGADEVRCPNTPAVPGSSSHHPTAPQRGRP